MTSQERQRVCTGSEAEALFGFSRAVRVGSVVSVAGTTAMAADGPVGGADVTAQAVECIRRIESALAVAGATLGDVVRTRVFVVDIDSWKDIGKVHLSAFHLAPPASTIVEVARLFDPRLLVEIEADAVVG